MTVDTPGFRQGSVQFEKVPDPAREPSSNRLLGHVVATGADPLLHAHHGEVWVATGIKEECLNRMMLFGEGSLHRAVREFVEHDHGERPHQGLGNGIVAPRARLSAGREVTEILVHDRLGGILRHYRRAA